MLDTGSQIVFELNGLTKTRKTGQTCMKLSFETYPEEPLLDIVSTLRCYIKATESLRKDQQLLISYTKPYRALTTSSVSRWIKTVMEMAGVNIETFKAHSVRGACTSKASAKGLATGQIMKLANWKRSSTFKRFYLKNISDGFQSAVLSLPSNR